MCEKLSIKKISLRKMYLFSTLALIALITAVLFETESIRKSTDSLKITQIFNSVRTAFAQVAGRLSR
jgi:hypothetical protein